MRRPSCLAAVLMALALAGDVEARPERGRGGDRVTSSAAPRQTLARAGTLLSVSVSGCDSAAGVLNGNGSTTWSCTGALTGQTYSVTFPAGTTDNGSGITMAVTDVVGNPTKIVTQNSVMPGASKETHFIYMGGAGTRACITDSVGAVSQTLQVASGTCPGAIVIPASIGDSAGDANGHTVTRTSATHITVTGMNR